MAGALVGCGLSWPPLLPGFFGTATLPPIVVMAQEMHPRAAGASSGIVMGLAWAAGALGVMVTGVAADVVGPQAAALLSLPVAGVAALLALHPALKYDDPKVTP